SRTSRSRCRTRSASVARTRRSSSASTSSSGRRPRGGARAPARPPLPRQAPPGAGVHPRLVRERARPDARPRAARPARRRRARARRRGAPARRRPRRTRRGPHAPARRARVRPAPPPTNDLLATEELLRKNVEDLLVVRERQIRGGVIVFRGELLLSPSRAVDALLERFRVFGYTPFVHADGDGVVVQAWPLAEVVERPRVAVNVVLFVLTGASTLVAGTMFSGSPTFDAFRSASGPAWLLSGVPFACTLLAILGVHEFGHYFTARHYGAQVSLPFFIPAP